MQKQSPEIILKNLEMYSNEYQNLKSIPQAHARAILHNKSSPEDWPNFDRNLDKQLYYMSYYFMSESFKLLEYKKYQKKANDFLKRAAESLEYMSKSPNLDKSVKDEIIFNSILAYYISGNYACSYVLTKENLNKLDLPVIMELIFLILNKNLNKARKRVLSALNDNKFNEEKIIQELENEKIDEKEAINRILSHSIFVAINDLLNFIKLGDPEFLKNAFQIINTSTKITKEYNFVNYWWFLKCLNYLLKEYFENSLWKQLDNFNDSVNSESTIKKYITNCLNNEPPIIELWPSQVQAIPIINDSKRKDFCVKMPTSAGKTRVAELTILRFFLDSLEKSKKCIYIAPFRSLAVEIEKSFRNSLGPIGFTISEIYGGFELNPSESVQITETEILVVTPEKFDAILRYMPEIKRDIGLIIIDEGHIVNSTPRGLNFEFFVQRLLKLFKNKDCRFLFISAVLPNIEEFTKWITGSSDNLVESKWRPSRLMIGDLIWNSKVVRIEYTHTHTGFFSQRCYIPNFIEQVEIKELPGISRRTPFPYYKRTNEALALSALMFAQDGTTLVFAPRKNEVNGLGKVLVKTIKFYKAIKNANGEHFDLAAGKRKSKRMKNLKKLIESEIGKDSELIEFLDHGFFIHHKDLPKNVRMAAEEMVRHNELKLIVATTTLAQGVNLPIKTVLIKGLQIGYDQYNYKKKMIDSPSFWNICGRAGRGGKENEGQILFFYDTSEVTNAKTFKKRIEARKKVLKYREYKNVLVNDGFSNNQEQFEIVSGLLKLLKFFVQEWQKKYPNTNVMELCEYIANNSYEWTPEESKEKIKSCMDKLDVNLLAISEEIDEDMTTPELLQEILENSLLLIQLNDNSHELAENLLESRITYIRSNYSADVRKRMYKLGMNLSDCETVELEKDYLSNLFKSVENWKDFSSEARTELLIEISKFILNLKGMVEDTLIPHDWQEIVTLWLNGLKTSEMIEYETIQSFRNDPTKLRLLIENICGNILPWGMNSLLNYLKVLPDIQIPLVCHYFSAMIKYGLNDPVTVCILPYVNQDRDMSIILTRICPYEIEELEKIIKWVKNLSKEVLINNNINNRTSEQIMNLINYSVFKYQEETETLIEIIHRGEFKKKINIDDIVILVPFLKHFKKYYQVFTLEGDAIGDLKYEKIIHKDFSETSGTIKNIELLENRNYKISILI